ncbi:MAG: N(2)-acetyl-L-2,4-diaminobutanoate deacetylase DoeB [Paracoccus sp. (in: a-proteobacteria)]|nr:N(2)-acetyl-L-2,4-diaminobutanoate deacetylase DoeB [Paracoccus sp. (in: a-proteobacteria)]
MSVNPITPTISLTEAGKRHGFLRLPYSRNDSAWGSIMLPLTVVVGGAGPTALYTGGNHGDEYEGPIALQHLAAELRPEDISGRVIIVPYMNYPAFRAGTRVSPVDGMNLNRSFPGRPDGTATQKIADYFQNVLVPMADLVLDYHSGGKTLDFLPFACAHELDDPAHHAACIAAMEAFGAPYSLRLREIDNVGMYDSAVEAQGRLFVTTELGGGGTATAKSVAIARRGALNLLRHIKILPGEVEPAPSVTLSMPGDDCYHFAGAEGLFEPVRDMGDQVEKGDLIARIWPSDRTGAAPAEQHAQRSGLIAARHFPGLIQMGDCLAVIAERGA